MVKPGNSAKKQCRKAERKWRRTDSDFLMFKAKKNHGTFIFRNAMRNYHTDFIQENSYDQYKLFVSTKILFDQDTDLTHQKCCDSTVLANDIRNFLVQKIKRIRTELDAVATGSNPHSEPASVCWSHFDWFSTLSDDDVMHLIANKSKLEVLLLGSHAYAPSGWVPWCSFSSSHQDVKSVLRNWLFLWQLETSQRSPKAKETKSWGDI